MPSGTPGPTPAPVPNAEHAVVHRDDGEFAAWPFNAGLWRTDDGVVAGYFAHDCAYGEHGQLTHARVSTYGEYRLAHSTDGGATWEPFGGLGAFPELSEQVEYSPEHPGDLDGYDLAEPDTIMASWSARDYWDPEAKPWVAVSADGGASWDGPSRVPRFHFERVQARPSYVVREDGTLLLFLSAATADDDHLKAVVYASFDGGTHWSYLSTVAAHDDFMAICPSPVVHDGEVLAAVRCNPTSRGAFTELYASGDGGRTWAFRSRVNDHGAPGQLCSLADGRLLCVYGYRRPEHGVRCRVSDDAGETWGDEHLVRGGGANRDLGYPRVLELEDGRVLTVYYYNEPEPDVPVDGGVRHVAATAFDVPA